MKKLTAILLSCMFLFFIWACGTIIHGTTQDIGVTSSPSGATVHINNIKIGQTPLTQSLLRDESHAIKIEMEGYEPFEMIINREVSGWVWGNIIFGGLIGLAIDAISGGMYKLDPETVGAHLEEKRGQSSSLDSNTLYIILTEKTDNEWQKIGQLENLN